MYIKLEKILCQPFTISFEFLLRYYSINFDLNVFAVTPLEMWMNTSDCM